MNDLSWLRTYHQNVSTYIMRPCLFSVYSYIYFPLGRRWYFALTTKTHSFQEGNMNKREAQLNICHGWEAQHNGNGNQPTMNAAVRKDTFMASRIRCAYLGVRVQLEHSGNLNSFNGMTALPWRNGTLREDEIGSIGACRKMNFAKNIRCCQVDLVISISWKVTQDANYMLSGH